MMDRVIIVSGNIARRSKDNDFTEVNTFNGLRYAVAVKSGDYTLNTLDNVVVFTATARATLPVATGTGQTYRIVNDSISGIVTIDGNGSDTIKKELTQTLAGGEDLIITDYASGKWI